MSDALVSDAERHLYLHDLDAETLRYLAEALESEATAMRAVEDKSNRKKMRHAHSSLLRLWADRFRTDANRLEDSDA